VLRIEDGGVLGAGRVWEQACFTVFFVVPWVAKLWVLGRGLADAWTEALALKQAVASGAADASPISDYAPATSAAVQAPAGPDLDQSVSPPVPQRWQSDHAGDPACAGEVRPGG
jgi:hypothetical protein